MSTLDATRESDYSLWKIARSTKRPKEYTPPIRRPDGTWARSNADRAETFACHLENTFQPNNINTDIKPDLQCIEGPHIKMITPGEIRAVIKKKLNPKKAPGHDLITARMLQELPQKGIVMITYLYNAILRLRYVPRQ